MNATIRDVAAAAGVSTATVSRALHGDPAVRAMTATRVREAAQRLHYSPSVAAARLATRRPAHVAIVVGTAEVAVLGPCLAAVAAELGQRDLDTVLHIVDGDRAAAADRMRGRADAVVLATTGEADWTGFLADLHVPAVVLGRCIDGWPSVHVERPSIGALAGNHLIALRHRRLAVLAPLEGTAGEDADTVARSFEAAARRGDPRADVQRLIPRADDVEHAERTTSALLSMPQPPTALFAATEAATVGAVRAFLRNGLLPGQRVALIGTGGEGLAADVEMSLVSVPYVDMGTAAARLVEGLVVSPDSVSRGDVVFEPQLVVRASTGRSLVLSHAGRAERSGLGG